MGFLHKDTTPDADLSQSGIRCTAIVEESEDDFGAMALRGAFGGGMMTEHGREQMLAGETTMSRRKVRLRIAPPGRDAYTLDIKIDYPMIKANWLYRGSSFEVLVDPNKPDRFAVDWNGPHQLGTVADLAGQNPMIAAAMRGAGIDIDAITRQQLAARQMGLGTPNVVVNGQLMGVPPGVASPAATPVAPPPATNSSSRVDELEKLAQLHQSGALTDEEFAAEKAKVLNS